MRLRDDAEFQTARIASLDARMARREDELEAATDGVILARARELLSHARWRAEREAPGIWGAKVETTVRHDISDDLRAISERRRSRIIDQHTTSSGSDAQSVEKHGFLPTHTQDVVSTPPNAPEPDPLGMSIDILRDMGGEGQSMLSATNPEETQRVPMGAQPESGVAPHPVSPCLNFVEKF